MALTTGVSAIAVADRPVVSVPVMCGLFVRVVELRVMLAIGVSVRSLLRVRVVHRSVILGVELGRVRDVVAVVRVRWVWRGVCRAIGHAIVIAGAGVQVVRRVNHCFVVVSLHVFGNSHHKE